jgi:hypothetical protein
MVAQDLGPGSEPISQDEVLEMIFSKWGMKLAGFVVIVFAAYIASLFIFGI